MRSDKGKRCDGGLFDTSSCEKKKTTMIATFRLARSTSQARKLRSVGVATDRDARYACLRFFSFSCVCFFCLRFFSFYFFLFFCWHKNYTPAATRPEPTFFLSTSVGRSLINDSFDPLRPMSVQQTGKHATKKFTSVSPLADWSTCRKNLEETSSKRKPTERLFSRVRAKNSTHEPTVENETPRPISIRPPPKTCSLAFCSTSQHWRPRQMTSSFPLALSACARSPSGRQLPPRHSKTGMINKAQSQPMTLKIQFCSLMCVPFVASHSVVVHQRLCCEILNVRPSEGPPKRQCFFVAF